MTDFVMPALGESVTEATVTRWLVAVGDVVEQGQVIVEVSTDKVDTEIESPVAGRIDALLVVEDQTVEVGTVLAAIGDGADGVPGAAEVAASAGSPEVSVDAPVVEVALPASLEAGEADPSEVLPPAEFVAPGSAGSLAATSAVLPTVGVAATSAVSPTVEPAATLPASPVPSLGSSVVTPPVPPSASLSVAPSLAPEFVAPASSSAGGSASSAVDGTPAVNTQRPAAYRTFLVRALAKSAGINLDAVTGTGPGGRIRRDDVLAAASSPASAGGTAGWALIEVDAGAGDWEAVLTAVVAAVSDLGVTVSIERGGEGLLAELRPVASDSAALTVGAPELRPVVRAGGLAVASRSYVGLSYGAAWTGDPATLLAGIAQRF